MRKIIGLVLVISMTGSLFAQGISQEQQRKLNSALNIITHMYVDSIKDKKIVESTLESILKELDPHSSYIPAEESKRVREPLEGSFEGVGIQFQIYEDTLLVVQTISGTPAAKVGIQAGDRILSINNENIAGIKIQNSGVFKRLRGPKGTEVTVTIKRGGITEILEFKIIRDKIPIYSVDATYMIGKEIGYIKINQFGSTTVQEFKKSLASLQKKGMKHLILSLKGNGGGYLNAATQLADEFLSENKLEVFTKGLNQPKNETLSTKEGGFEKGKLIVLVDEYSASASEIVSGAIQDWDRGIIVGRRTFGKGLVQSEIPFYDGSYMRLTVARYYTPTGRCIQKSYKEGTEKYHNDLINRYKKGEFVNADSIHLVDTLKYHTLTLNRTVYGGGGIMPDVFVPFDTTRMTPYYINMVGRGVVNKVVMQYIDKNRTELKTKYSSFEKFKTEYQIEDAMMDAFVVAGNKEKVKFDTTQYELAKPLIKLQLKALIARDLWEMNEYNQIMDADNETLQKAIEILQTAGAYEGILKSNH
jgi:carboxyl-terminal processing protease